MRRGMRGPPENDQPILLDHGCQIAPAASTASTRTRAIWTGSSVSSSRGISGMLPLPYQRTKPVKISCTPVGSEAALLWASQREEVIQGSVGDAWRVGVMGGRVLRTNVTSWRGLPEPAIGLHSTERRRIWPPESNRAQTNERALRSVEGRSRTRPLMTGVVAGCSQPRLPRTCWLICRVVWYDVLVPHGGRGPRGQAVEDTPR
jgi:hypothetical protein